MGDGPLYRTAALTRASDRELTSPKGAMGGEGWGSTAEYHNNATGLLERIAKSLVLRQLRG